MKVAQLLELRHRLREPDLIRRIEPVSVKASA